MGYYFFKYWVWLGLHFYFKSIRVVGLENIPKEKPVLFLSNHQSALIDVLLVATLCGRKPWYLTRADVFKSNFFRPLFSFLQMLPIYRMRDGKGNLAKNQAIFDRCARILDDRGCILLFPEANHNLKRRVRPLSKGFTRIVDNALEKNPEMDLQLIPIGQNYKNAIEMADSAALYFGEAISLEDYQFADNRSMELRKRIFEELKKLTTHIEPIDTYEEKLQKLEALDVDFTNPIEINQVLASDDIEIHPSKKRNRISFVRFLFYLWNVPIVFLWRLFLKPRVPEPEFMATYRFGFAMLVYPIFYIVGIILVNNFFGLKTACLAIALHAAINYLFVKAMPSTSSAQRK